LKKIKAYIQVVMHCDDVPDFSNRCEPNVSTWVPPSEDCVKANIDAAVFSELERMRAGCVIRDYNGNFLVATKCFVESLNQKWLNLWLSDGL
jgi:hypothetical protein